MTISEFERASASVKALNPHLFGAPKGPVGAEESPPPKIGAPLFSRGDMNRTEREFAAMLERQKRAREIVRYDFEGITLRWADMRYTPDFVVIKFVPAPLNFIEVKGGHIWDRDIVRFKGARAYWPEFEFEMWQKRGTRWCRLH